MEGGRPDDVHGRDIRFDVMNVELRQLVGEYRDLETGKVRRAAWNMDQLFLNGRQIATINRVPGAPIGLLSGAVLTAKEREAVENAVAAARGGVKPGKIDSAIELPFELLDDEEGEEEVVADE